MLGIDPQLVYTENRNCAMVKPMNKETQEKKSRAARENGRDRRRRRAAAAVAVVTSASVVAGGLFQSPAELLDEQKPLAQMVLADDGALSGGGDDGDDGAAGGLTAGEEEERAGLRAALRQRVRRLPYALRLLVILPLWALGWSLLGAASALWTALLSPILGKALAWLMLLGALLGAFVLAGKAVFPDLPVKKILNRRSLLGLVIGSVALGTADIVAPFFWADYARVESIARGLGLLLLFGTVTGLFVRRELRRRRARAKQEAEAESAGQSLPRIASRQEILAMADSVCRPR